MLRRRKAIGQSGSNGTPRTPKGKNKKKGAKASAEKPGEGKLEASPEIEEASAFEAPSFVAALTAATPDTFSNEWTRLRWVSSLSSQISEVLASAITPPSTYTGSDFEYVKNELDGVLSKRLTLAVVNELKSVLRGGIATLQKQDVATAADLNSKFADSGEAAFALQVGSMGLFYKGLEGIIGGATLRNGSFEKQLEYEHCASTDSEVHFKTPQTKDQAKVKPSAQWYYVLDGREAAKEAGKEDATFDIPGRNGEPLSVYDATRSPLVPLTSHRLPLTSLTWQVRGQDGRDEPAA